MLSAVTSKADGGNDRAVSPVVGVILMVAIVVILAAVVAAALTGMTDGIGQTEAKGAAEFSVDEDKNTVTVSVTSLSDADEMHLEGDAGSSMWDNSSTSSPTINTTWDKSVGNGMKVGNTYTFQLPSDASTKSGTITAVAVKTTEDGETVRTTVGSQDFDFN